MPVKLMFVQISDSHIGPSPDVNLYGFKPYESLDRIVSQINDFPIQPDFVIHTGDLINDQSEASYQVAASVMKRLKAPLYLVNGNHDDLDLMRQHFGGPLGSGSGDYLFEVKGERFMVIDAYHQEAVQPAGLITPEQIAWVRAETEKDGPPLTVFLHFIALKMESPWLDRRMLIENGDILHEALLPAQKRLRGVFHGHLHHSSQIVRDGITYTCALSTWRQYTWRLWDEAPHIDPVFPSGYNLVYYMDEQVVVHQYTV